MMDRRRGYGEEFAAQGLPVLPELVWSAGSPNHPLAPAEESARAEQALAQFILPQRLEAVIVGNDVWAVHLLKALRRHGLRVPEDLAVIGFDNLDLGLAVSPELTTIDQENAVVAYHLVSLLVGGIEGRPGPADPGPVFVRPRLIVRQTS
jgi:DNA-binding LacI/PurR family transcriptional regulator